MSFFMLYILFFMHISFIICSYIVKINYSQDSKKKCFSLNPEEISNVYSTADHERILNICEDQYFNFYHNMIDCSKFIWSLFRQISDDQIKMLWPQKMGGKKNVQKVKSTEPDLDYDVDDLDLSEQEDDGEKSDHDVQQVQTTKDFNWKLEGHRYRLPRFPEITEEMKNKLQIYFTLVLISIFNLF